MLSQIYDQLLSGKQIHKIVFADGESIAPQGLKVDLQDGDDAHADAWVCWNEDGIWLSSNADVYSAAGYHGKQGREDPLANIRGIVFMPE
jgi:hypothetical protein